MPEFLKRHPFAVEAFFESSSVLTFAVPKEELERLIPECLTLDTFHGRWAFLAVALVQTTGLRPQGFPKIMGSDFFLIGYRIFVRYTTASGKRLRGLYILRSETDSRRMELLGNTFTHYRYVRVSINRSLHGNAEEVVSVPSGLLVVTETPTAELTLPEGSPFSDWAEARRFAGPLPFTFSYDQNSKEVLIIEGVRENWVPQPINVLGYRFPFLESLGLRGSVLASAFTITGIPYHWKKGRVELWRR